MADRAKRQGFQPLSGMDAGFLYMETPTLHMHTLKIAIMRPADGASAVTFDSFRRTLERKIALLPSFHQRILPVPFGVEHPVWVTDPDFDPSRHLAHRTAPAPGGMTELNAIISEVASRPLLRDRPLWEITMVDGLEGDRVAFVCKLHHSMADGAAAMAMLQEVFVPSGDGELTQAPSGDDRAVAPVGTGGVAAPLPTQWALRRYALVQGLRRLATLPMLVLRTLRGVVHVMKRAIEGKRKDLPAHFSGPRTRWSGALTARRSFGTTQMPLDDMKRVKKALGVTLNDVFLAMCGGALRVHLEQVEGGIPAEPLLASVPVNTHPEVLGRMHGNHVANLSIGLCTHIADPVERVRAIHEMSGEAKERQLAFGPDLLERWIEYAPAEPYMAFTRFWSSRQMADQVHPPVNLIVSNVAGPRKMLHIGSHGLEAFYSVGPILEGIGLNLTGWSYGDRVCFVGLACPDQIEDIQALVDRLPSALEELIEASEASAAPADTKPAPAADAADAIKAPAVGHAVRAPGVPGAEKESPA